MAEKWKVVVEPEGKNPTLVDKAKAKLGKESENMGGMIVFVADSSGRKEEVSRVAWVRRVSRNPKNSFEKQLKIEVGKAKEAVAILNDLAGDGMLQ